LGVPPPKNLAAQKHQNFGFRDLIALETAITPLCMCVPNLVNFGPQMAKNRTLYSTHSVDFFGRSYLSG